MDGSKALVRNSSGAVVRLQVPSVLPSVASGGGAASLKASQALVIGNAVAELQLTRNVAVANVAKVARVAARVLGPLALLGLVYDGVQWVGGEWLTDDPLGLPVGATWGHGVGSGQCANAATGGCTVEAMQAARDALYTTGDVTGFTWEGPWPGTYAWPYIETSNRTSCLQANTSCRWIWRVLRHETGQPDTAIQVTTYSFTGASGASEPSGVPASDQDLEISFQQGLIASPSLAGQVLDAALASSAARAELAAEALQVAGPATVDGGTTTSTRVDTAGTTTIQTATTYNLSYQGDTVNVTQTSVETVTDPSNNVTTTTTTTATPTGDPPPPEEQSKFCEEFPDASACQELGEHEPDGELGEEERALSWLPELSAAGSCPGPITLSIMGSTQSLEWSSVCDLASGVRPVVIALAWLSAAVFVFGVGRVTAS